MTNKGLVIKTVIIGAALTACIIGVWVVSAEQKDSNETVERIEETAQNVPETEFISEKVYGEVAVTNPVHFGRTIPAWNKYEAIEVTDFESTTYRNAEDESDDDNGSTGSDDAGDTNGEYSEAVGGTEPEYAADEYNDSEQEIPVEEPVVEEPVEELPAPEESTVVEEPVEEAEPVAEEPVVEEPVVDDGGWSYYASCRITHYCPCELCCSSFAYGPTASGVMPTSGHTVAMGSSIPFGTEIMINGQVYVVEDRGVDDYSVDIYVDDHQAALNLGLYYADVYVRW